MADYVIRSAANTVARHGLTSPDRVAHADCLKNENPAEFILLHETCVVDFAPTTNTEYFTVHEIAVCQWRLHRYQARLDNLRAQQHRRHKDVELQAEPNPNNGHLHDPQLPSSLPLGQ